MTCKVGRTRGAFVFYCYGSVSRPLASLSLLPLHRIHRVQARLLHFQSLSCCAHHSLGVGGLFSGQPRFTLTAPFSQFPPVKKSASRFYKRERRKQRDQPNEPVIRGRVAWFTSLPSVKSFSLGTIPPRSSRTSTAPSSQFAPVKNNRLIAISVQLGEPVVINLHPQRQTPTRPKKADGITRRP